MTIFEKRINYKPFEYPEVLEFTDAINKSFWVHSEIDFTGDVQDFKAKFSPIEQEAVKRSLLAIAQIEVAVKTFWWKLYEHLPKPEFNWLGSTFAECEFRHSQAYSRLLEVLGYNEEFDNLIEVPVIKRRIDYLTEALENMASQDKKDYSKSLILFTILIENVSLFSQFATILSFTRFKWYLKNVSNIIAWTSVDEQIHANAGIYIINEIKKEFPDFFTSELVSEIRAMVKKSLDIESEILDWIFEEWELEHISKKNLLDFMKNRVDQSLDEIWVEKLYNVSSSDVAVMYWFDEEIHANAMDDFFAKRPVDYTKHDKSISGDDLF